MATPGENFKDSIKDLLILNDEKNLDSLKARFPSYFQTDDSIKKLKDIFSSSNSSFIDQLADEIGKSASSENDKSMELYKLEYEIAAERYENIYKGIWTNFSYMTAVTGAILVFGNNFYPDPKLIAFLACLPLLFWYFISFIPLNGYGYKTQERLKTIEDLFERDFGTKLSHYSDIRTKSSKNFIFRNQPRVGPIMLAFAFMLLVFSCIFAIQYFYQYKSIEPKNILITETFINRIFPTVPKIKPENGTAEQLKTTVASSNSVCDNLAQGELSNSMDKLVNSKLSIETKKNLCAYVEKDRKITSALQISLARDINNLIEGNWICGTKEFSEKCGESDSVENLKISNKQVFENEYAGTIEKKYNFPYIVLPFGIIMPFILIFLVYELQVQFRRSFGKDNN